MPKQDESLVDEMRAALQGDLERSRLRNGVASEPPVPERHDVPEQHHEPQVDEASSSRRRLFFRRK